MAVNFILPPMNTRRRRGALPMDTRCTHECPDAYTMHTRSQHDHIPSCVHRVIFWQPKIFGGHTNLLPNPEKLIHSEIDHSRWPHDHSRWIHDHSRWPPDGHTITPDGHTIAPEALTRCPNRFEQEYFCHRVSFGSNIGTV